MNTTSAPIMTSPATLAARAELDGCQRLADLRKSPHSQPAIPRPYRPTSFAKVPSPAAGPTSNTRAKPLRDGGGDGSRRLLAWLAWHPGPWSLESSRDDARRLVVLQLARALVSRGLAVYGSGRERTIEATPAGESLARALALECPGGADCRACAARREGIELDAGLDADRQLDQLDAGPGSTSKPASKSRRTPARPSSARFHVEH